MTIALIVLAFLVVLLGPDIEIKGDTRNVAAPFLALYLGKALMLAALLYSILRLEGRL